MMAKFEFENDEKILIKLVVAEKRVALLKHDKAWDDKRLEEVKYRLKDHNLERTGNRCCYCLRNFSNNFRSIVDGEHILPKSKWPQYTFTLKNLSIACKRCNTSMKNTKTDFLVDSNLDVKNPFKLKYYKLIHPNLDQSRGKLELLTFQTSANGNILKYLISKSPKAKFTYDYFELKKLEEDSFTEAQGAGQKTLLSEKIPLELIGELLSKIKKL